MSWDKTIISLKLRYIRKFCLNLGALQKKNFRFYSILVFVTHRLKIRIRTVRETSVSRHHGEQLRALIKPLVHHRTIVLNGLRGALNWCSPYWGCSQYEYFPVRLYILRWNRMRVLWDLVHLPAFDYMFCTAVWCQFEWRTFFFVISTFYNSVCSWTLNRGEGLALWTMRCAANTEQ